MFALWYGVLTYREYRDAIWERFFARRQQPPAPTAVVCPLPPKKIETSKIPVVEPPKPPRTPSPIPPRSPSPMTPDTSFSPPQASSTPIKGTPDVTKSLEPPAKPPRSPSPHPIRAGEPFEDIEYEEEEEEEEEESSEVEEDDENSVISSSAPRRPPVSNSVNEFINQEINQPNSLRLNQTR